jgi:hypothetical protein
LPSLEENLNFPKVKINFWNIRRNQEMHESNKF